MVHLLSILLLYDLFVLMTFTSHPLRSLYCMTITFLNKLKCATLREKTWHSLIEGPEHMKLLAGEDSSDVTVGAHTALALLAEVA